MKSEAALRHGGSTQIEPPMERDDGPGGAVSDTAAPDAVRREARRLWTFALIVLAAILILHFSPLRGWIEDLQAFKQQIAGYGWKAYAAFCIGSIAVIALGVPRLILCGTAGILFGFVAGSAVALVSGILGAYGAFLLARWGGGAWTERKLASVNANLRRMLANPTVANVFIARQLPLPGLVINFALGLLPIRHDVFLVGTSLGLLPSTIVVALAGSSLGKESLAKAIGQVSLSMGLLGAFSVLVLWLWERWRKRF